MDQVRVEVGGRIPKYLFATLEDKYREELLTAIELCNEEIETEQDFLNLILQLTLELAETRRVEFFEIIHREDLETLPNFNRLVSTIIAEDWNHFDLIQSDFLKIPEWNNGYLTIFEGDAHISIWVNDEIKVDKIKLSEFSKQIDSWDSEDDEKKLDPISLKMMKDLISSNREHFYESIFFTWGINLQGCYFLEGFFIPPNLFDFFEASRIENIYNSGGQLSIYFDDYTDWNFYIESENFNMDDLVFVNWNNCDGFRNSAHPCCFVQLFHKNILVQPEEIWYRDKGITLSYEDETLDMLFNM